MSSLFLNLLIFWLIWNLIIAQRSQRRQQKTAGETIAKTKRKPARPVRRGLTGPFYQEQDEEMEIPTQRSPRKQKRTSPEGQELKLRRSRTDVAAVSQGKVEELSATDTVQQQTYKKTSALSLESLLAPDALIQSLILTQVLSEPRCKRTWRAR